MTVVINIDDLARRIAAQLRSDDLWLAADVAAYLKCEPRTVSEYYAAIDGFPKAIRLPNKNGERASNPRWVAAEIKEWARSHRGGAPTGRRRKAA